MSKSRSTRTKVTKDDDGGGDEWEHFTITFVYEDDDTETVPVMARDADDALNLALNNRSKKSKKVKTSVVQDGIGDVIKKLQYSTAKRRQEGQIRRQAVRERVGAYKQRIKYAAGAPGRFKKELAKEKKTGEIEALVKAGQDTGKKFKARAARNLLKKKYPSIYKNIAWKRV